MDVQLQTCAGHYHSITFPCLFLVEFNKYQREKYECFFISFLKNNLQKKGALTFGVGGGGGGVGVRGKG